MALIEGIRRSFGRAKEGVEERLKPVAPRLKAGFARFSDRFSKNRARVLYSPDAPAVEEPSDPSKVILAAPTMAGERKRLDARLEESAEEIFKKQKEMARYGGNISRAIADRLDANVTLAAWVLRFAIALLWGAIAAQLVGAELFATSNWIFGIGLVATEDLRMLTLMFGGVTFAALIAIAIGVAVVYAAGRSENVQVRRAAEEAGRHAARLASEFDKDLRAHRSAMEQHRDPVGAVTDLSQAHLTALEAAAFFRDLNFLTNDAEAEAEFARYLGKKGGARSAGEAEARAFLLGVIVGAMGMVMVLGPPPVELPVISDIKYPAAIVWVLLGGIMFFIAGLWAEVFRGIATLGIADDARRAALQAMRSGFVATNPPRVEDISQRIVDALEVFKARVAGAKRAGDSANHSPPETPSWRRGPEAPRFVDTPFAAAPAKWRVDPHLDSDASVTRGTREIFSTAKEGSETPPKRGLFALKKPGEKPSGA